MPAVLITGSEQIEDSTEQNELIQLRSFERPAYPAGNPENNNTGQSKAVQLQSDTSLEKQFAKPANQTGLPDTVKSGIESLSGYDMSDVKVHYNSSQPTQLKAFAFAKGTDIHVAPGQEKHVAHEAWHVVQQKQGRVQPTMQMKQGVPVNDDEGLEKEADAMGAKVLQGKLNNSDQSLKVSQNGYSSTPVQRKVIIKPKTVETEFTIEKIAALRQPAQVNAIITGWVNDPVIHPFTDQTKMIMKATQQLHDANFDGSLQSLATEMSAKMVSGMGHLTDESLWDILKRAFEANWFKAKSCLAMNRWPNGITNIPDHKEALDLMEAFVTMRQNKWEAFAATYLPKAKDDLADQTLKIQPPDGSTSVTSDMDLSITGAKSEAAIEYLNVNFRTALGVPFEPGTVFDINMYSLDWMHGDTPEIGMEGGKRVVTIVPEKEEGLKKVDLAAIEQRSFDQEVWSYVKVMRNLSDHEITDYKAKVLEEFKGAHAGKRAVMSKKLEDAHKNTKDFKKNVADRAEEMAAEFYIKAKTTKSAFKTGAHAHDTEAHFIKDALTTSASNDLYQKAVKDVNAIRVRIKLLNATPAGIEGESIENLAIALATKIAEALTYANEVYSTEGGVLHTVYGKQKAKKKQAAYAKDDSTKDIKTVKTALTKQQYIQSINENVGDSIHAINHNSHIPKYAAFRSGKYLDRLCEATELINETAAKRFTNYQELRDIGTLAATEKDGLLGRDPLAVNGHAVFSTYDNAKLSSLKQKIIVFGTEATSYFNRTG